MQTKTEFTNIASITSNDVVGVEATFSLGDRAKGYLYKAPRSLAETLTPGDMVLVQYDGSNQSDRPVAPVLVRKVFTEFDPEDMTREYKWIFQKVAEGVLLELEEWERSVVGALMTQQRQRARRAMMDELGLTTPTGEVKGFPRLTLTAPIADGEDAEVVE